MYLFEQVCFESKFHNETGFVEISFQDVQRRERGAPQRPRRRPQPRLSEAV